MRIKLMKHIQSIQNVIRVRIFEQIQTKRHTFYSIFYIIVTNKYVFERSLSAMTYLLYVYTAYVLSGAPLATIGGYLTPTGKSFDTNLAMRTHAIHIRIPNKKNKSE